MENDERDPQEMWQPPLLVLHRRQQQALGPTMRKEERNALAISSTLVAGQIVVQLEHQPPAPVRHRPLAIIGPPKRWPLWLQRVEEDSLQALADQARLVEGLFRLLDGTRRTSEAYCRPSRRARWRTL